MTKKAEDFDYRAKSEELERIVVALQDPDIQIDEATRLHDEGQKLLKQLEEYLAHAEIVVRKHVIDSD